MRRKVALDATGEGAKPLADAAKSKVSTAARWMKVMVISDCGSSRDGTN